MKILFLFYVGNISAKQLCRNGENCVLKLKTLTLEDGSKIEKGLVRIQNDEEEKNFCNTYGMESIEDNSSDIVFRARDYKQHGRYPICRPANQMDYSIKWESLGKIGCVNACHKRCFNESCDTCDDFCQSKDAKCCSGLLI